jgi:dihydrolipoamide dehydrogenase
VCTGTASLLPDVLGLIDAEPWTSRDATSVQNVPTSLTIIGGGVVAVEMATAFAGFGCAVTVLSRGRLLDRVEPFAGEMVAAGLRALGVTVHTDASATSVERSAAGVTVHWGDTTVTSDEVLVAIGRVPRTNDLGLDVVGLADGDWLTVDDTLRVRGHDWLYAVGDSNHRALLTHQGKYQARIAGDVIAARAHGTSVDAAEWGVHAASADHAAVPQVIFSSPEVAAVGLTESQAREAGRHIRTVAVELGSVSGAALHSDSYAGRAQLVVDEERGTIIGATFVGEAVAELLHAATIAVVGEVPLHRLWHAVPSFPTMSEAWLRLLEAYGRPVADGG